MNMLRYKRSRFCILVVLALISGCTNNGGLDSAWQDDTNEWSKTDQVSHQSQEETTQKSGGESRNSSDDDDNDQVSHQSQEETTQKSGGESRSANDDDDNTGNEWLPSRH